MAHVHYTMAGMVAKEAEAVETGTVDSRQLQSPHMRKDICMYVCMCVYIYTYAYADAVKLFSGPSLACSGVIIWAK